MQRVQGDAETPDLRDEDIRHQTLQASGAGGQHGNKTDSAVRAAHVPTEITTMSQRSQFANKKIARLKLALLLEDRRNVAEAEGKRALCYDNCEVERGNAIRTYLGERFKLR